MRSFWHPSKKSTCPASARRGPLRPRLGCEELEIRNLMAAVAGLSPTQLLQAYGFSQLNVAKPGLGETIAIVDAYQSPNIQADLTAFDTQYNLPATTLTVVNDGATRQDPSGGWQLETALDVEWAHAIAPYAKIDLIEAANDNVSSAGVPTALLHAVSVASSQAGVNTVSMSWGVPEFKTEAQFDSYFNVPGVTFVAAAGDSGAGPIYPSISPNVVSVGGTTLQATTKTGVYVETGWGDGNRSDFVGGGGGGVSRYEKEPAYQQTTGLVTSLTSAQDPSGMRTGPDVAYDADPNTGVAVYDKSNGGWIVIGGTSAGTPQWAALVAIADQVGSTSLSSAQTLTALYKEQGAFYDVTSGNNGYAAGTGYDLVTGLGSPEAQVLVPALAAQKAVPASAATSDPLRTAPVVVTSPTPVFPGRGHHGWWNGEAPGTTPTAPSSPAPSGASSSGTTLPGTTSPTQAGLATSNSLGTLSTAQATLTLNTSIPVAPVFVVATAPAVPATAPVITPATPIIPVVTPVNTNSQAGYGGGDDGVLSPAGVQFAGVGADTAPATPMSPTPPQAAPVPEGVPAVPPVGDTTPEAVDAVFSTSPRDPEQAPAFWVGMESAVSPAVSAAGILLVLGLCRVDAEPEGKATRKRWKQRS